jgi:hypothetical protein
LAVSRFSRILKALDSRSSNSKTHRSRCLVVHDKNCGKLRCLSSQLAAFDIAMI